MAERPEDLNLPNSVIAKIIKDSLPEGVNVSKDARLAISKAASVFVLYATSCANNFAMQHKRKTIGAPDVFEAMTEMDFGQFVEPLKKNLEAYKQEQKGRKDATDKRKKDKDSTSPGAEGGEAAAAEDEDDEGEGGGAAATEEDNSDDVEPVVLD